MSVDPLTKQYPELTPYQYASNTPIEAIDLDGLEKLSSTGGYPGNDVYKLPVSIDVSSKESSSLPKRSIASQKVTHTDTRVMIRLAEVKCHPGWDAINERNNRAWAEEYAKLDHANGQIHAPRTSFLDYLEYALGGRETFTGVGPDGKLYFNNYVNALGYITDKVAPHTGIPPGITLVGSGPVPGVIELSERVKSTAAFENAVNETAKDFIFDPNTKTLLLAGKEYELGHSGLARVIGADENVVVGGRIKINSEGVMEASQWSGHYGGNWNSKVMEEFEEFMKKMTNKEFKQTGNQLFSNGTNQ